MKRTGLLILFFVLATLAVNGQSSKLQDKILWNMDSIPTWDDYQARPPKGGGYGATTMSGVEVHPYVEDGVQKLMVGAYFYRQKSWVQPDQKSDNIYDHEIVHFHITELYARKLRKELYELGKKDLKKMQEKMNDLFYSTMEKQGKEQERYDKETSGSLNYTKQKEWKASVMSQLEALKEYENPVLEFVY
jgi:hypothetical protein